MTGMCAAKCDSGRIRQAQLTSTVHQSRSTAVKAVCDSVMMKVSAVYKQELTMNVHAIAGQIEQYHHGGAT